MDKNQVNILLVEDNPYEAKLAIRALSKSNLGSQLFHVKDGAEALDFVLARGAYTARQYDCFPKIILLDLKLPKIDGLEVVKELKANALTRSIPIVILTASSQEKDIITGYELGVNSYIVKPIDFNNFSKTVTDLGLYWVLLNETPEYMKRS